MASRIWSHSDAAHFIFSDGDDVWATQDHRGRTSFLACDEQPCPYRHNNPEHPDIHEVLRLFPSEVQRIPFVVNSPRFETFLDILRSQPHTPRAVSPPLTSEFPPLPSVMTAALTPDQLIRALATLTDTVNNLTTNVNNLTAQVANLTTHTATISATASTAAPASSSRREGVVKRPDTYDGEGMDASRIYRTNFQVWLIDNIDRFTGRNADGSPKKTEDGKPIIQNTKRMASFMSFLTGKAASWARPHLEKLGQGEHVFGDDWEKFLENYKANFEPLNEEQEARAKIRQIRQGSKSFATYKAEFEQYSGRTGWDDASLMDYLRLGLNDEYGTRISYYEHRATTYAELVNQCQKAETQIRDLQGDKAAKRSELPAYMSSSSRSSGNHRQTPASTATPMDIDASRFESISAVNLDKEFADITPRDIESLRAGHRKIMSKRCMTCGSTKHRKNDGMHQGEQKCKYCGKDGHWSNVCLNRLLGRPKSDGSQKVAASVPVTVTPALASIAASSSTSEPAEASLAAMLDMIKIQQKNMDELMQKVQKHF